MDDRYLVSQRWVHRERRDQGEILVDCSIVKIDRPMQIELGGQSAYETGLEEVILTEFPPYQN